MQNLNNSDKSPKYPLIAFLLLLGTIGVLGILFYLVLRNNALPPLPKVGVVQSNNRSSLAQTGHQDILLPAPTSTPPADPSDPTPVVPTPTPAPSSTPQPPFNSDDWANLPVIPETVSSNVRNIYLKGLSLGNRPGSFSKVGDCNSLDPYFLSYFDLGSSAYDLGAYGYLQPMIDEFNGSFKRVSEAVGNGFNTSAVLSPFRANPDDCNSGESPLQCEYRIHKPSFVFISIGTDDYLSPDKYEANLRQILDYTIQQGIVPILVTKMDDANQLDYNPIIAKLAYEYNIPLINLWRALQPLPDHGLLDNIHPSGYTDGFNFSEDYLTRYGWPNRNLDFLRGLYVAWTAANQE